MARSSPPRVTTFAAAIREAGLTQTDAAEEFGISQAHVSRIVRGEVIPGPELAFRLAQWAGIPVDSFTFENLRWRHSPDSNRRRAARARERARRSRRKSAARAA